MAKITSKVDARTADVNFIPTSPATEGTLAKIPGLSIPEHDYIELSYTGTNLTGVVYKTGGSGGTTVATLTLAYDDNKLISITKT